MSTQHPKITVACDEGIARVRILAIGATGGTGLEVVRQALARSIDVTAIVRSPEKLGSLRRKVTVVDGDVFHADVIAEAATGVDAVLSSIGAPGGFLGRGATTVYSRTAAAVVRALAQTGVRRLIFCTSAGVEPHDPGEPLPYRLILKPLFLQRAYDDMITAETTIGSSNLDWTLVRPSRLVDRPVTGRYTVSPRMRTPGGKGIARADVATFMLDQVTDTAWVHATPTLTRSDSASFAR